MPLNYKEFEEQYSRLKIAYPAFYDNDTKKNVIFWNIVQLDKKWFSQIIARIILSGKPEFDFLSSSKSELSSRNAIKRTNSIINHSEELKKTITDEKGLEFHLSKMGAKSLVETLFKEKDEALNAEP